jgi:ABC-2 type transport system ATP-binding protein
MALVELNGLWVHYGKKVAVRKLSFEIPEGEVFGFIGPNGAGKTTTIKVLATLLKPTLGSAIVAGYDVVSDPMKVRRIIGYMPDFFGVYDDLTVKEYLHFFAAAYGLDGKTRRSVVGDCLALTDLTEKSDDQVDSLSRGMNQRPRPESPHRDPRAAQGAARDGEDDPRLQPHPA